jgi:hypothetical protein
MAYLANATNGPNGGRLNIGITGNTAGTPAINSTGIAYLAAGTNLTLSQNSNTINFAMPRPGGTTQLSRWEAPEEVFGAIGVVGQGSLSLQHQYIPYNVTGQSAKIAGSITVPTGLLGNASATLSLWMGVYSLNGSTLKTLSTGSTNNLVTWNAALFAQNPLVEGVRQFTVPMNVNITPGEYWIGAVVSSSTANGPPGLTMYGNNLVAPGNSSLPFLPLGTTGSGANDSDIILFQGIHKTASYTMPPTIQKSQIDNANASNVQRADFYYALYNSTY